MDLPNTSAEYAPPAPRPGLLLVLVSVPLCLGYFALATLGCTAMFAGFEVTAMLGAGIWLFFGGYLLWIHYRAVVRAEVTAAEQQVGWFQIQATLLGLAIAVLLIKLAWAPEPLLLHVLTILFVLLLFSLACWGLFRHWARQLRQTQPAAEARQVERYSLRELLVGVTLLACVLGVSSYLLWQ